LRIQDASRTWRIVYFVDPEAVVILEVFAKTTQRTPKWDSPTFSDTTLSPY
jgi:phage-related protein